MVHHDHSHGNRGNRPTLVCGYSLEINATSDMDFFLSVDQVHLLTQIYSSNFAPLLKSVDGAAHARKIHPEHVDLGRDEASLHDSGVESETSTLNTVVTPGRGHLLLDTPSSCPAENGEQSCDWPKFTPFDVLLTAGKISFMVYSHNNAGVASGSRQEMPQTKADLEWKGPRNDSMSEGEGSTRSIVPFLYAYFSQPYSLVSCLPDSQKVELSCYDTVLKGTKPGHSVSGRSDTQYGQQLVDLIVKEICCLNLDQSAEL